MPMIYDPGPGEWPLLVELRQALTGGIQQAAILAATDFIAKRNQPWTLYAGVAAGVTAAACGIPGGAATLYVIGDVLDFYVFKSPKGSLIRIFLDGVAMSTVQSYAAANLWEAVQVQMTGGAPNQIRRVDIVNDGPDPNHPDPNESYWTGVRGPFTVTGGRETLVGVSGAHLAHTWTIRYTIEDNKGQESVVSVNVKAPAVIQSSADDPFEYAKALGNTIHEMTRGRIVSATLTRRIPTPPTWQYTPLPGSDVEEKGVFKFLAGTGNYYTTVTVPTFDEELVGGWGEIDTDAAQVEAFVNLMTRPYQTAQRWNVRPCDARGEVITRLYSAAEEFSRSRESKDDD